MGPTILLDKSSLQSFSKEEISFLYKHYFVVIPPVLLIECLADLKKFSNSEESKREVQKLANKFQGLFDSKINLYFRFLCIGSLLGEEVRMERKAVIPEGILVRALDGTFGRILNPQPEQEAIRNWQKGQFEKSEEILAEQWRLSANAPKLEEFRRLFQGLLDKLEIKDLNSLRHHTEMLINKPELQKECLDVLTAELRIPEQAKILVYNRWLEEGMPPLINFAPYSHFCLQVIIGFVLGTATGLLSTRPTNLIDLEYFFYAPFANIFCSSDRIFHQRLWPAILQPDQTFIAGDELKADLRCIAEHWDSLTEVEKKGYAYHYGTYPPENPNSRTYQVWKKYCFPWKPGSGNQAVAMSEEEQKKFFESTKPFVEAIRRYTEPK